MSLNEKQIEFLKKIGTSINDDIDIIESKVSECLQLKGFNKDYSVNETGIMCESILDNL